MPVAKLTKAVIDRLPGGPEEGAVLYWDLALKGFGLAVHPPSERHPKGKRSFLVRYRAADATDRRMVLGAYGALTPDQARKLARAALAQVAQGRDPLEERREQRRQRQRAKHDTVAAGVDAWLAYRAQRGKKESTSREIRRLFAADVLPVIGRKPLAEVSVADVRRVLARKAGAPYAANRVRAWLRAYLGWAIRAGLRETANPCDRIEPSPEKPRTRSFSLAELARIGEALRARPEGEADAVDAITLLALLGLRRNEVLHLRWSEVDFERRLLALEDGKSGGRLKALGREALAILRRRARAAEGAEYVFPGRRGAPRRSVAGVVAAAYTEAKIEGATAHHVLRHSYTTHAAELGLPAPVIAALVGHRDGSMTGRYTHLALDGVVREADEKVQRRLARALAGEKAAVVELVAEQRA